MPESQDIQPLQGKIESQKEDLSHLKDTIDRDATPEKITEAEANLTLIEQNLTLLSKRIQQRMELMTKPDEQSHREALGQLLTQVNGLIDEDLREVRRTIAEARAHAESPAPESEGSYVPETSSAAEIPSTSPGETPNPAQSEGPDVPETLFPVETSSGPETLPPFETPRARR